MDWSNQVVLITGASSGIGRGLALELARRGAAVGLLARRRALLEELAAEITRAGGRALALPADVTQPDEVRAVVSELRREFGRVAALPDGSFVVTDGNRVFRISPEGATATVAGRGDCGYSGDGGPAISARLALPQGLAPLPDGAFLIADGPNARIRQVSRNGIITTVAGGGGLSGALIPNPFCGASPEYSVINGFAIKRARSPLKARR